MARDFDPWELFEVVEVNLKKKKRSRCRLCGEQWWDIGPSFILEHMGFEPGREVQKKYAKGAKINDPANSVWREKCAVFQANTMRVKEAKKAAKLQGGITQQSAEDATFQQNGWTWSLLVRRDLSRPSIAPSRRLSPIISRWSHRTGRRTLGTASRTLNARLGFPYDAVNREPQRGEAAGRQVGCGFLRVWNLVRSCKFGSVPRCS